MLVRNKVVIKLPDPDPAGHKQFQINETVERHEMRITTIEAVENMITYHQAKIVELRTELAELQTAQITPIP